MASLARYERPGGVYLVAFYFVVAGFLEAIQKIRDSTVAYSLNPLAEHSVWTLGADIVIYLALAFLIWNFAAFGRLAALVYAYVILGMYAWIVSSYLLSSSELRITPLFLLLAGFNLLALPLIVAYLQPARRKALFRASLWDILLSQE